ncbi:hypothetical protein [Actinomadura madurae]|uniref:hypothetical protein n=1 Tax=Actinomadura madurae TaxID=1993 RepID=UPI0020D21C68|nr:hypothetical protein [Actinomadura madurae]MCP9947355.1 hypothetical protein [Actinomadura madurae]MCP9964121.1 hypothetical protein [Actinomadura madurae]MCP9976593.1 hypothetical protein [Actinomadura madurae]MCQ0011910.1 hypothetical protein [Actinomadura madurae]
MTIRDIERTTAQLRALGWLTRQPLTRLPLMVWFAHEDGGLIGTPADLSPGKARRAFDAWVSHLRLVPDPPRHRGGLTRLRAQGRADGILITVHAAYRPA